MDQTPASLPAPTDQNPGRPARVALVDSLRGLALLAMIVFHFSWDLEFLGLAELEITANPYWIAAAQTIAGTFLVTVGISLVLAHTGGLRPSRFLRRLLLILAAAGAVTLASAYADPEGLILFGILHCIAVSSVLGLFFLRAPLPAVLAAIAVFVLPPLLWSSSAFNGPGWVWLGLASEPPPADDYIPLMPWFGAVLAGIAIGRLAPEWRPYEDWARWQPRNPLARLLAFAGRHTLLVYLVHQPVLLGTLWLFARWRGAG